MKRIGTVLLACFSLAGGRGVSQKPARTAGIVSLPASEWFQRASDQMNLRIPGAAPFHMKVTFHALPGDEMLGPKDKPQIITGDGVYEETWLAAHHWRREVTLGSYHAIEVETDQGRKMQASSDYEPSRVLMLLTALMYPVSHMILTADPSRHDTPPWSIAQLESGGISMVRVAQKDSLDGGLTLRTAYFFLPKGLLVARSDNGITTSWGNDVIFGGRAVPASVTISTASRQLLTAEVRVEAAAQDALSDRALPGSKAEPGMTLRPLLGFSSDPRFIDDFPHWEGNQNAAFVLSGVIDRNGRDQELELIFADQAGGLKQIADAMRRRRSRPAEIDGSRCEVSQLQVTIRTFHAEMN